LAIVGLGAAIWALYEKPGPADASPVRREASVSVVHQSQPLSSGLTAMSDAAPVAVAPVPSVQVQQPEQAARDDKPITNKSNADPPSVDTEEPAQRKFARGRSADPDQN
jgi:hypothetical protein